jgi:hypothetical protein
MDIRLPTLWIVLASSLSARAAEVGMPHELDGWQSWVLHGEEYRACPFLANQTPGDPSSHRCAWPGRLQLLVDAHGGSFTQSWRLFAESWIALPGSVEFWPENVRIDGAAGAVVARDGRPMARLSAGEHRIEGRFAWSTRPESLPIPTDTGIVDLSVGGHIVSQPERSDAGIGLGRQKVTAQARALEVQVYRLLEDNIPAYLTTIVRLQVAGDAREELLSELLPAGFVPIAVEGVLPARIDAGGRLRVQVRAGSWEVAVLARGHDIAVTLQRPPLVGTWAREEIWSFAGADQLRIAVPEGATSIDPNQANVPKPWAGYPAFRMAPETRLTITERSRGLANVDDNRLRIERQLWLDFDHQGFTAVDTISGTMRRDWRLDMQNPFHLAAARVGADSLLVTDGREDSQTGVELRSPNVGLSTTSRIEQARGSMPASGWNARFENVAGILNLAPGHRLLAVGGADYAPGAWLDRWGLWNLFGVLVVVVFTAWVAGNGAGALALAALALMYQEEPSFIWLWGNVLIATAAARAAPQGRLSQWARFYRSASLAILGIALLPLLVNQLRLALYPQLEAPSYEAARVEGTPAMAAQAPPATVAQLAAQAPAEVAEIGAIASKSDGAQNADALSSSGARRHKREDKAYASGGMNVQQVVQRYAPGTVLQTGPGLPAWHYETYRYGWSGPVEPAQQVHFYYTGPLLTALWRILGAVLSALLFFVLFRHGGPHRWRLRAHGAPAAMLALLAVMVAVPTVHAASTPDAALLQELHARLAAPPACAPTCAEIMSARVTVKAQQLEVEIAVSALAPLAVAVPGANDRWQIESITLDGASTLTLARDARGSLWVPLARGSHAIRMTGRAAAGESIQLVFPMAPRRISVSADGWEAAGLSEGRLPSGTLELVPRHAAKLASSATAEPGSPEASTQFPAFVRVVRNFNLDLDWSIQTLVQRIAPQRTGFTVAVPLVANEAVLSSGVTVQARNALVGIGAGEAEVSWSSGLARSEALNLDFPAGADRSEVWIFHINPQWSVTFGGIPAVLPEGLAAGDWAYEFHPRPGERLSLAIRRPKAVAGQTLAIDSVRQQTIIGARATNSTLRFSYRSTQGGRHTIGLPPAARVTAVTVDGQNLPLRPEKGELPLALLPGTHLVNVDWTTTAGPAFQSRPDSVELHAAASNIQTRLELPESRWPLAAWGSGVGPAVLYWGELCVFIVLAILLGRVAQSPIRTHEWLLLGLGLSTLSWVVFTVVTIWLFLMRWRTQWRSERVTRMNFNSVQVLLAAYTLIAVTSLIFSGIRYGLLAHPDMSITGPGSIDGAFEWFNDKTASPLPSPMVFSVPMWVYKTLIFIWALWIALALRRWLSFAWRAWTANGTWRGSIAAPQA